MAALQGGRAAGRALGNRVNVSFLSLNRNKRSITLDLKSDRGKEILYKLVAGADVFLQNYRPGVAERLGVGHKVLSKLNDRLIYVSISGYGETGPYAKRPGQDLLLQAMSGAMFSSGAEGAPPAPSGQYIVDSVAAYSAFEGVLAALLHRERTGEAQRVDVNMLDAIIAIQMQELSVFTVGGIAQTRSAEPHAHSYIRAPYGIFETSNGYIAMAFANLTELGRIIGEPSFEGMDDEVDSWDHRDAIFRLTREKLVNESSQHWLDAFAAAGLWAGPVYGYEDVLADPQVAHNGTFVEYDHPTEGHVKTPGFPIRFEKTPSEVYRPAPLAGQHTREVLAELGIESAEVDKLFEDNVVSEDLP